MRALQKDRNQRFQDAASFRRALRAAGTGVMPSPGQVQQPTEASADETTVIAAVAEPLTAAPLRDKHDAGPSSRAMAKVMAGEL